LIVDAPRQTKNPGPEVKYETKFRIEDTSVAEMAPDECSKSN